MTTVPFPATAGGSTIAPMSYMTPHAHPSLRHRSRASHAPRGDMRRWLLNAGLLAVVGLAGYGFVTEIAVPGLVSGIFGSSR